VSELGGQAVSLSGVQSASVTFPASELKNGIGGSTRTLVSGVAGKIIVVLFTMYQLNGATVAWTQGDIAVQNRNADFTWADYNPFFQGDTGTQVEGQTPFNSHGGVSNPALTSSIKGDDLVARCDGNGNAHGNGSITVTVFYQAL